MATESRLMSIDSRVQELTSNLLKEFMPQQRSHAECWTRRWYCSDRGQLSTISSCQWHDEERLVMRAYWFEAGVARKLR